MHNRPCDNCPVKTCSKKMCDRYIEWFTAVWAEIKAAAKKMEGEEHAAENVRKVIETALIQNGFDDVRIEECKVFLVENKTV